MERVKATVGGARRSRVGFWLVSWLVVNIADYFSTLAFIANGSKEANPIFNLLWASDLLLLYKTVIPLAVVFVLWKLGKLHLLKPLSLIIALIVVWNVLWAIV